MDENRPDIFDDDEENVEEEPEEEEVSSDSEDEGEVHNTEPDYNPWEPLRERVEDDGKKSYMAEVQRLLDMGKTRDYAESVTFNVLLPLSRKRFRGIYLRRLKWMHSIKHDALHRQVMKTLHRFMNKDDMDFDEAADAAVDKRKFLLNRLLRKKVVPDNESEVDEEAEEQEREASENMQHYY